MSDILTNASRYNSSNSTRIDGAGKNAGNTRSDDGSQIKFDCSGLVYHVLRESGYNVPYSNSSAMSNTETFNGGWATPVSANGSVPPGTLVYFGGHVGIVRTYNPATGIGTFLSMTGSSNAGDVKPDELFSIHADDKKMYWGGQKGFKGFAAVKPDLYDPNLDQHANGANPDHPVFNIPEHKSVGFVTLPDNGGFPKSSAALDLSSEPTVAMASPAATTKPLTNLYDVNNTSPFAETLAHLESSGQPFEGYRAVNDDGDGIGAVGRYGFRASSLKAIGWMDAHGDWTSAAKAQGINSVESFLSHPQGQEAARVAYMQTLKNELKANGAWSMIGETVEGHTVTEAGLIAAAWKEGAGKVVQVFNGQSSSASVEKNVFFRLDEFGGLAPGASDSNAAASSSAPSSTGHWEDPTQWDEMGNVIQSGPRVWVSDDTSTTSISVSAGAGRGKVNPPTAVSGADQTAVEPSQSTTQISADGTTATLPNGQVIHAGPGGKLDIDAYGILTVSRPAQGWANADGSPADIRQITTYEPSGAQIGTSIAQNLPGEAALVENHSQRTLDIAQADGSTTRVDTHFQAGVGWVDDAGNTVLSLKDAQAQKFPATPVSPESPPTSDPAIHPVAFRQVQIGGVDYDIDASGAYKRNLPGGDVEWRDPATREGVIADSHGAPKQHLSPSERVELSDNAQGYATVPVHGGGNTPRADTSVYSFSAYLQTQGEALNTNQQIALAGQLDSLNLGDVQSLSYYTLPDGSALIANVDGDLVGQISAPKSGEVSLRANAISADGNATTHESYIDTSGNATSYSPSQLVQVNAGLSLLQGLDGLQHWDQMDDVARFSSLVGLVGNVNTLSGGELGNLGSFGTAASVLGLYESLKNGNTAGIIAGVNALSEQVVDKAIGQALGVSSAEIPYMGVLLAVNDFEKHPGQSLGTLVGNAFFGPIGGAIGGMLGGLLDGGQSAPPPPVGIVHFSWNSDGLIQHTVDVNQSNGGQAASSVADSVQHLLEQVIQAVNDANAKKNGDHSQDVALNPYLLPRVHFVNGVAALEITQPDGTPANEPIGQEGFTERLISILQDNGALAPAWQVQTVQGHWALAQSELDSLRTQHADPRQIEARQQALDHELSSGKGGHAYAGNEAYSLQGNANESADFKTQDFGVLVVHITQHSGVQASLQGLDRTVEVLQQMALERSEILRDVENDGYAERTDWVAAADSAGNTQGLLVLDQNSDGLIETCDILNLGGNAGHADNLTPEAALASRNAAIQHNNVQWLDANGDGLLDARDPAFAAIKLWVDVNQDGQMEAGESHGLLDSGFESINFMTGEVVYASGLRDALIAATLRADTEGVRLTHVNEVNVDGTLHELNAVTVLEHEGYQGQLQIADQAGTRWGKVREQTFEQEATCTGDWEGTADQEEHRHYGDTAAAAQTENSATGTISLGSVKSTPNAVSTTAIREGDSRIASNVNASPVTKVNAQTIVAAGDIRIKSDAQPAAASPATASSNAASNRLAFVPSGQQSEQTEIRLVTSAMTQSAQDTLFGTGLGLLAAVGLGATASAAEAFEAVQRPRIVSDTVLQIPQVQVQATQSNTVFPTLSVGPTPQYLSPAFVAATLSAESPAALAIAQTQLPRVSSAEAVLAVPAPTRSLNSSMVFSAATVVVSSNLPPILSAVDDVVSEVTFEAIAPQNLTAPISLPPVVVEQAIASTEDQVLLLGTDVLMANDYSPNVVLNPELPTLTITAVDSASHGRVQLANGEVLFIPDTSYHGSASFSYTVTDQYGLASRTTAHIQIAAVNDIPVAVGESTTTNEDTGLVFTAAQLLANDSDVDSATDGQVLTISAASGATHGSVWMDADGNVRFAPDANYHGPASFQYTVSDGNGGLATATVNIIVVAANDIPVVVGESTDLVEDNIFWIDAPALLGNDSDVDTVTDGQVLRIIDLSGASHGTVYGVNNIDGREYVAFRPDANFHGQASFQYTVSDGNGGIATATVLINYAAVNDAPVATGESAVGNEDQRLVFASADLLANDTDADTLTDDQVLSISRVGLAEHGTVVLSANGEISFIPDADYNGPASFSYWVSDGLTETPAIVQLTIAPVNDIPIAVGELVSSDEDVVLIFNPSTLLANDSDADVATDGQALCISALGSSSHCTVAFVTQADGSQRISFTPEANYFGVAGFQYVVSDGQGGTATAAVVVNLASVNDVPVARDDTIDSIDEDNVLHISFATLLANDTDADSANAFFGATDDTLTVVAVGYASHGTVVLNSSGVTFTPDADYHGPASFAYQVQDSSGATAMAYANFSVLAVNDTPVAVGETVSSDEDTTLLIQAAALLINDSDADTATDGQILSINAVGSARHGSVSLNSQGDILFVPEANYFGTAGFEYTVSDGQGGISTATTTIVLAAVNDAPVGLGETIASTEDQVLRIEAATLLANDGDIDNLHSELSIARVESGTGGTVALDASGAVVFTPTANFNGTASFTYWVCDPTGLESSPVITIVTVAAVNDAPSAQGEIVTGAVEDAVFHIPKTSLLANDHDLDDPDSALSLSWVGSASGGIVSLDANGDVVFSPSANFNGNASFQYKVRDAAGLESPVAQAVIPVAAVNDSPLALDDILTPTYRNSNMTVAFSQLTSNDSDVDGDVITVSAVRDHSNGHASILSGQVQFTPTPNFVGTASFDYCADDGHGGQTWATAFVDVKRPPNLYPTIDFSIGNTYAIWYGGSAYYSPTDIFQNFSYVVDDESPGTVSVDIIPLNSAQRATYHIADAIRIINGTEPSPYYEFAYGDILPYPYSPIDSFYEFDFIVRSSLASNIFQIRQTDHSLSQYGDTQDIIRFNVVLTDADGLVNIAHVSVEYNLGYPIAGGHNAYNLQVTYDHSGYYSPPIAIDLNGDGIHFTSLPNSSVSIDVNNDGIQDKIAWTGNDDGILVWDKDHNREITDVSEFGFQHLRAGAQTDLEGLQSLDTNQDGLLSAADEKFAEFAVWQDANGNGVADSGEFLTLQERGIASINLHSDGQVRQAGTALESSLTGETDAVVMGNATFTRTDGSTGVVADAMLAFLPGQPSNSNQVPEPVQPAVPHAATDAELNRQAALFNQFCNADTDADTVSLGFIPVDQIAYWESAHAFPPDGIHMQSQAA
ncbi:MAG: cadherin-like domain-containing protein [Rhodoferax sp.]